MNDPVLFIFIVTYHSIYQASGVSRHAYVCLYSGIDFSSGSKLFRMDFETVPAVLYFLFSIYHFHYFKYFCNLINNMWSLLLDFILYS